MRFELSYPQLEEEETVNGTGLWSFAEIWVDTTTEASWINDSGEWTGEWIDDSGHEGEIIGELGTDIAYYQGG